MSEIPRPGGRMPLTKEALRQVAIELGHGATFEADWAEFEALCEAVEESTGQTRH